MTGYDPSRRNQKEIIINTPSGHASFVAIATITVTGKQLPSPTAALSQVFLVLQGISKMISLFKIRQF
jgi:hypothetical protein